MFYRRLLIHLSTWPALTTSTSWSSRRSKKPSQDGKNGCTISRSRRSWLNWSNRLKVPTSTPSRNTKKRKVDGSNTSTISMQTLLQEYQPPRPGDPRRVRFGACLVLVIQELPTDPKISFKNLFRWIICTTYLDFKIPKVDKKKICNFRCVH